MSWLQEPVLKIFRIKYATRIRLEKAPESLSFVFRGFDFRGRTITQGLKISEK